MSVRVIPAILTDDPKALGKMVRLAETFTDYVQIDYMDGRFVPSKSVTGQDTAAVAPKLGWEAHIMVQEPETYLEGFRRAGARRVIFHYEATPTPLEVIAKGRSLGLKMGLAINPGTAAGEVLALLEDVDCLLLMAVHPGFYGARFIPEVLDKVPELRRAQPSLEIGIDGGIKENNIAEVARAGLDDICVGSAILVQPDPAAAWRRLQSIAAEAVRAGGNRQ